MFSEPAAVNTLPNPPRHISPVINNKIATILGPISEPPGLLKLLQKLGGPAMTTRVLSDSELASVYITEELYRRSPKRADHLQEKLALQDLAARMVNDPEGVLPRFVDLAMELGGGVSAGMSLLEDTSASDNARFRWHYLRGTLERFEGATTPRNFSPCGITLDQNRPVLTFHSELLYDWISEPGIILPEVLLVPLYFAGLAPSGTLWVVSDEEGHFDKGHVRAITELATFVDIALRMRRNEIALKNALSEQETLAKEMSHRVKNLFAMVSALIQMTGRRVSSAGEMTTLLMGRVQALAAAHTLVRRSFGPAGETSVPLDFGALVQAVLTPYENAVAERKSRFSIYGSSVGCGEHTANGLALVIHELATNAAKYGALMIDEGTVSVTWSRSDAWLILHWIERGGPPIEGPPQSKGFGSSMAHTTVVRQLHGTLDYDWDRAGLGVTITIPIERLSN